MGLDTTNFFLVKIYLKLFQTFFFNRGRAMAEGPAKEADLNGYDKHWFVKKERALEFRCETCSNILKDPQQIIICGHQFCRSCLPKEVK
jgi:hypothetical protein